MKNKKVLVISFLLVFIIPTISSFLKWGGMPPGYGLFPAEKVVVDPPFNLTYFLLASAVALIILVFLLFPRLFGFKKYNPNTPTPPKVDYPSWFYPSLIVMLISWFLMWARIEVLYPIEHFTFVPLWWGAILVLDGIVYKRNGGISLISSKPNTMKLLAVTSAFSWFVFEYLNFFVLENWYYPNNKILTNFGNISWQLVSYTTVLPAIFEWYSLLKTFKKLDNYYKKGPILKPSMTIQWVLLILGLTLLFLMGYFPFLLFWVLWVSLVPVLVPAMNISKLWNPFTDIAKNGNWSFVILIAIATVINGFFWEFWNFGSEWFHDYAPTNPNYWKYSIPYLDKFYIFSEMPVLGYFGYLFFGNVCWVLWLVIAYIIGFDPSIKLRNQD